MTTNAHAGHVNTAAQPGHAEQGTAHGAHAEHGGDAHAPHNGHAAQGGAHEAHDAHAEHGGGAHADHNAHTAGHDAGLPGGLRITQDGYTLDLDTTIAEPGKIDFRFRILGPDGSAVTEFDAIHDRELHLIVARRELTGFWHVHPRREADGTWVIQLDLPEAGAYRVFTDIAPRAHGRTITLGADLAIAGHYAPQPVPAVNRTTEVDGYEVTVDGELRAEGDLLTLTVRENGEPVADLQPYLAAFGHLVILRAGDLAYVHVHPNGEPGDGITPSGPEVTFHTAVPGPGTYRLFLDFKHNDVVRTAAFTLTAVPPLRAFESGSGITPAALATDGAARGK
ncbi:hypothetical protein ACFVJ5_29290 [Nocardia sp. NPDC127606]|uniref:hypothetical protein n=1 Tax=Nocardia sp. NPDC127606 TaxID=3345406 RepID=UPI003644349F